MTAPALSPSAAAHRPSSRDDSATPTGTDGGRADSYGWGAEGVIATGRQVRYEERTRNVINPQTGEEQTLVARIGIH